MTFTKTAGFLISVGLLCILYVIETERFRIQSLIIYSVGVLFIILGWSIRASMFLLVIFVFFSAFISRLGRKREVFRFGETQRHPNNEGKVLL